MRRALRPDAGVTLLELVVALALLGLLAAVAGVAFRAAAPASDPEGERHAAVARARREALQARRGVPFTVVTEDGRTVHATALPDGRVLDGGALGLDALTGRPRAAR